MYSRSPLPRILLKVRCRGAFWPARSAGMNVHARPRWSVSRPGDRNRATTSHLQRNPRKWRSDLHQVDHTQLDGFWSQMRCRRVLLLASRISVPSPATPCTLFTPNGAPCGLSSRICFLSFAGANSGACLRMVKRPHLSTLHLVSHTDALYTKSPLGRLHGPVAHIGRMHLSSVQHAPPTHYQPQCGRGADCPARWSAPIKSRRRR